VWSAARVLGLERRQLLTAHVGAARGIITAASQRSSGQSAVESVQAPPFLLQLQ